MHTPETRHKFVERRAQGWSLVRIAAELGVARSILIATTGSRIGRDEYGGFTFSNLILVKKR